MPPVRRTRSASGERVSARQPVQGRRQVQQAQQRLQRRQIQRQRPIPENYEEDKPTPLLFRILVMIGVLLLCFVLGYVGTSWLMNFLNRKLLLKPDNRIENQEDLNNYNEAQQEKITQQRLNSSEGIQQISLSIYHVQNDNITETRKSFLARTPEENIRDAVNEIISLSGISGANNIKLLHVFRNSDTVFLDMSGQFASALEKAGQRKSLLLLTSIVRTLQDNFSPISQVRFLIDSKAPKSGGVVDLSSVWKLPKRS